MPRQGPITERQKQTTVDGLVRVRRWPTVFGGAYATTTQLRAIAACWFGVRPAAGAARCAGLDAAVWRIVVPGLRWQCRGRAGRGSPRGADERDRADAVEPGRR